MVSSLWLTTWLIMRFHCLPHTPASAYISLGADLDLGGKTDPDAREFQQAMLSFTSCVADFIRAVPIYRLVPTPLYYRAAKAVQTVQNIGKKYLDSNKEKIQRCVEKGARQDSTLWPNCRLICWLTPTVIARLSRVSFLSCWVSYRADHDSTSVVGLPLRMK